MYYATTYRAPMGELTLASDGENLLGLWMEGQKYFGGALGDLRPRGDLSIFAQTNAWLDRYFAGERPTPHELPLAPVGTPFRQAVWTLLCEIPYGQVRSYGGLANQLAEQQGRPMSSQAVGGAVGHNPISIIIPCHRVVGSNGSLTGYAGGIEKKRQLLAHEGADLGRLFVPKQGTAL